MMLDNRFPTSTVPQLAHQWLLRSLDGLLVLALCCAFDGSNPAQAGFSVELSVNGGFPAVYLDNAAPDLNPAVGDIEIDFAVSDAPPVSTIVTDTLIEKLTAGLINGQIEVTHNYVVAGPAMHDAMIDGQFENTLGNPISFADLNYTATVNNYFIGSTYEGPAMGVPGPVPFSALLGPVATPTTTEHVHTLSFYLDSPGDAIRLFDSAEIHTFVPEPGTLALAGACLAVGMFRRRTRKRKRSGLMKKQHVIFLPPTLMDKGELQW
jgi:hypothetical protein